MFAFIHKDSFIQLRFHVKKALICGVSGQDGAYLSKLLLEKGYNVYGGSRDAQMGAFGNLGRLGIMSKSNWYRSASTISGAFCKRSCK